MSNNDDKPESKGTQIFNVPNDTDGQYFLHLCRKYRQNGNIFRSRGRGSRRILNDEGTIENYDQDLPPEMATWLAVYISNPNLEREQERRQARWYNESLERAKAEGIVEGKRIALNRLVAFLQAVINEA